MNTMSRSDLIVLLVAKNWQYGKRITPVAESPGALFKRVDLSAGGPVHVGDSEALDSEAAVELVAPDKDVYGRDIPLNLLERAGGVDQPE